VVALQESRRSGRLRTSATRSPADALADPFKAPGSRVSKLELEDGVRALLETQLDSFEKLEIMQALRTSARTMSHEDVAATCQLGADVVEDTLTALERTQWIAREGHRRIRPGRSCADPRFAVLMLLYAEDRAGVLAVLSSVALQRIRSMAATAFADAFVQKKRGNDD
jgi:hypothetical protein